MDKQAGTYPTLEQSACYTALIEWLSLGGRLLVVTSDDGYRPFAQFWEQIPLQFRTNNQVLLSTAVGNTLFSGDARAGQPMQHRNYWTQNKSGLPSPQVAVNEACLIFRELLTDLCCDRSVVRAANDTLLLDVMDATATRKYRPLVAKIKASCQEKIPKLQANSTAIDTEEMREMYRREIERRFSESVLLGRGKVFSRGTVIWPNQAGPLDQWVVPVGDPISNSSSSSSGTKAGYTNVFLVGVPRAVSALYLSPARLARMAAMGIECSAAPNSICFSNARVDKASPIAWLAARKGRTEALGFDIFNSLALGDCPEGNDKPLAKWHLDWASQAPGSFPFKMRSAESDENDGIEKTKEKWGMPFISVAPECKTEDSEPLLDLARLHVGHCEVGTAAILRRFSTRLRNILKEDQTGAEFQCCDHDNYFFCHKAVCSAVHGAIEDLACAPSQAGLVSSPL